MLKAPGEAETCWAPALQGQPHFRQPGEAWWCPSTSLGQNRPQGLWLAGKWPLPRILGLKRLGCHTDGDHGLSAGAWVQPSRQEPLEPTCAVDLGEDGDCKKKKKKKCKPCTVYVPGVNPIQEAASGRGSGAGGWAGALAEAVRRGRAGPAGFGGDGGAAPDPAAARGGAGGMGEASACPACTAPVSGGALHGPGCRSGCGGPRLLCTGETERDGPPRRRPPASRGTVRGRGLAGAGRPPRRPSLQPQPTPPSRRSPRIPAGRRGPGQGGCRGDGPAVPVLLVFVPNLINAPSET